MADALGWRCKVGLLVDAADIVVQPECEGMRPVGVTNHTARMDTGHSDKCDAARAPLFANADVDAALVRLMSPSRIISFWRTPRLARSGGDGAIEESHPR